jgi:hypothetical protein
MGEGTPKARTARASDGVRENFQLRCHPGKDCLSHLKTTGFARNVDFYKLKRRF